MEDFERELKAGFLEEAQQGVADVEQCFLALETNPNDSDNLNKIFRLAHNLKGSSKAVGFDELGSLTHEFETFILKVKNGELKPSAQIVTLLLKVNDFILSMIDGLKGDFESRFEVRPLIDEMKNFSEAQVEEAPLEETAAESAVAEPAPEEAAVSSTEPVVVEATPVIEAHPSPEPQTQPQLKAKSSASSTDESIRVSLAKVETLINYVGELVILQSVMREQVTGASNPSQRKTMQQMEKVSKEIQDLAMGLRMVPIKPTFLKMQRIVRDTAQALKKDVVIDLSGEDTELDKTVLEKLNDPLVHLIRNSVDHGIEQPSVREEKGKKPQGLVRLSAVQRSGRLEIEVRDDGGGLDAQKLRKKAIEKNLIKPDAVLSEKDCFNLIFAPGFSTKEVVTDVSGRGVGMDVVKTNIQELGGEIQIESILGQGTAFRVLLPLTLAIIESMIVTSSGHRFVIPMNHVFENLQPNIKNVHHDQFMGDVLLLREENLPMVRLGDFFGLKSSKQPEEMIAMVVRTGTTPFALLVDDILGQFQVVVKQLGSETEAGRGVSGVTILGDGKPALILEPADLVKRKQIPGFKPEAKGVA